MFPLHVLICCLMILSVYAISVNQRHYGTNIIDHMLRIERTVSQLSVKQKHTDAEVASLNTKLLSAISTMKTIMSDRFDQVIKEVKKVDKCSSPPFVGGTSIRIGKNRAGDKTATYSCKKRHVKIGGSHRVSTCINGVWSRVDLKCTDFSKCYRVYHGRGVYSGRVAMTASGRRCQRWSSQSPHKHSQKDSRFIHTSGLGRETAYSARNYCRDPDKEGKPWCYTTSSSKRWEFCNIPPC